MNPTSTTTAGGRHRAVRHAHHARIRRRPWPQRHPVIHASVLIALTMAFLLAMTMLVIIP